MAVKQGRSIEWVIISKKTIYMGLLGLVLLGGLGYGGWQLYQKTRDAAAGSEGQGQQSARFVQIEGKVLVKRANEPEFRNASEDLALEAGDTIQTMANAVARVQFIDGSSYTIKPDTTLVIKDNSLMPDKSTRVQVSVGFGRINLATGDQAEGSTNVVQTKTASARIGSQTEASVTADDKNGETEIRIARGTAKVNTQTGESYEAKPNEKLQIAGGGRLMSVERMVPVPELSAPANQEMIRATAAERGRLNFSWKPVSQASSYKVELATSAYFSDTVVATRDQLKAPTAVFEGLQPGVYYWRVRANSEKEGAGQFSEPYKFSLVSGTAAAPLNIVVTSQSPLGGNTWKIEGQSQPGARVKVGDVAARVNADGGFSALITLSAGRREVTVEATDQDGNSGRKRLRL
ncbi:MAG: FecR domain-containing protein [Blastocatellia bacterium]